MREAPCGNGCGSGDLLGRSSVPALLRSDHLPLESPQAPLDLDAVRERRHADLDEPVRDLNAVARPELESVPIVEHPLQLVLLLARLAPTQVPTDYNIFHTSLLSRL